MRIADLFCGAGGSSTGMVRGLTRAGFKIDLTAINHWDRAIETHSANHAGARHQVASLDALNPRALFKPGELDILWGSPECTHHSRARGGKPINEQSRATAWCVTRWAEALRPKVVIVENVPEFVTWGPLRADGEPLQSRKGELFLAWVRTLEAVGYRVEWRTLVAADYGAATTRERLFVVATLGRRRVHWPDPTHTQEPGADLFGAGLRPWVPARDIIDWTLKGTSIYERDRPLMPKTLAQIEAGLWRYGIPKPFLLGMEHGGRLHSLDRPINTITARGGAHALVQPYLIKYYGTGTAASIDDPLDSVTTKERFGLVRPVLALQGEHYMLDVLFRMLQPHELAAAQGFPATYCFAGNKTEIVKQIGNAVPPVFGEALALAAWLQRSDVGEFMSC